MRKELKKLGSAERHTFRGTFARFGTKAAFKGPPLVTVLLYDLCTTKDEIFSDHIWLNLTKGLAKLELQRGDIVEFDARVGQYVKGYVNYNHFIDEREVDYHVQRPTHCYKIGHTDLPEEDTQQKGND